MVRPAAPPDTAAVWELIGELAVYEKLADKVSGSADALSHWLFEERLVSCLVKESDGNIVGYALFFSTFSTFRTTPGIWLEDIFVRPDMRGRGFGKELLQGVVEQGRRSGFGRIEWSVLDWNEPAIGFYQSLGASVMPDWRICRIDLREITEPSSASY